MSGYQEIVTDPSYAEQLVCFTAPMVGNYGVSPARSESSARARPRGAHAPGGGRGVAAAGWQRRASSRSTRSTRGASFSVSASGGRCGPPSVSGDASLEEVLERGAGAGRDGGSRARRRRLDRRSRTRVGRGGVSHRRPRLRLQAVDRRARRGRRRASDRLSRTTSSADAARRAPDGILLSNGPGDPAALPAEVGRRSRAARARADPRHLPRPPAARAGGRDSRPSSFRSATAARTIRCSSCATNRVLVTSQNHGFAVEGRRARGHARLALRRHGRGPGAPRRARPLGAVPSRGGPGARTTPGRLIEAWVEELRLAEAA